MFLFLYLLGVTLVLFLLDSCDVVGGVGVLVLASKGNLLTQNIEEVWIGGGVSVSGI